MNKGSRVTGANSLKGEVAFPPLAEEILCAPFVGYRETIPHILISSFLSVGEKYLWQLSSSQQDALNVMSEEAFWDTLASDLHIRGRIEREEDGLRLHYNNSRKLLNVSVLKKKQSVLKSCEAEVTINGNRLPPHLEKLTADRILLLAKQAHQRWNKREGERALHLLLVSAVLSLDHPSSAIKKLTSFRFRLVKLNADAPTGQIIGSFKGRRKAASTEVVVAVEDIRSLKEKAHPRVRIFLKPSWQSYAHRELTIEEKSKVLGLFNRFARSNSSASPLEMALQKFAEKVDCAVKPILVQ